MSLLSRLLFGAPATAANVLSVANLPTLSPWAGASGLQGLVYSDIYGPADDTEAVTRDTAMTVAPLARGRGVIIASLADQPFELGEWDGEDFNADEAQPAWLTETKTEQTAYHRFLLSLDDLMFTGWCLWAVERDDAGQIIDAARVDRARWTMDPASPTGIALDQRPVTDPRTVMLFMGPHDGLLTVARDTIRGWRHMERAWVGRVRNPIPALVITEEVSGQVSPEEVKDIMEKIAAKRMSPNGALMFLPYGLKGEALGNVEADLYNEGRNAARIDVANHMNLPVSAVDGSTATASLTYVTKEGDAAQLSDDLDFWIAPFEARLSKEAPAGKAIRLRRSNQPDAQRGTPAAPAPAPEANA